MALGMLPTAQACTPRDAAFEFAIVGDAATAVSAIRWAACPLQPRAFSTRDLFELSFCSYALGPEPIC